HDIHAAAGEEVTEHHAGRTSTGDTAGGPQGFVTRRFGAHFDLIGEGAAGPAVALPGPSHGRLATDARAPASSELRFLSNDPALELSNRWVRPLSGPKRGAGTRRPHPCIRITSYIGKL